MFVLAHLSDPHLPPLPTPRFVELLGKRITGYLNWRLRRASHHSADVLNAMIGDIATARPDHVVVTGDLINLALPGEFEMARAFLARLGPSDRVSAIPGNHDAYVRGAEARYLAAWRDYLSGDVAGETPFPFVRRRGPVALVALSTAVATLPFFASGRLHGDQLERLAALLAKLRHENCFRVVLIHHPPAGERSWLRRFEDADAFRTVVARHGAELILSGHDHIAARHEIPGPDGTVPVVQVPAASARFGDKDGAAAYNLYRIGGGPGAWTCEVETRAIEPNGRIGTAQRLPLLGAPLTSPRAEAGR